ncbi:MAG: hypothetical protein R3B47_13665 [Bacteroidia bacterium]
MVTKHQITVILATFFLISNFALAQIQPSTSRVTTPTGGSTGGTSTSGGGTAPSGGGGATSGGGTTSQAPAGAVTFPFSASGQFTFTLDSLGATEAALSWSYPKGFVATAVQIDYSNTYTSTSHPLVATVTQAKIPRALPVGLFEQWKLIVTDNYGSIHTEIIKLDAHYGGAVLVVEDVYFNPVIDNCKNPNPEIGRYYFVSQCIVSTVGRGCFHVSKYTNSLPHPVLQTPEDTLLCRDYVYDRLNDDLSRSPGSWGAPATNSASRCITPPIRPPRVWEYPARQSHTSLSPTLTLPATSSSLTSRTFMEAQGSPSSTCKGRKYSPRSWNSTDILKLSVWKRTSCRPACTS